MAELLVSIALVSLIMGALSFISYPSSSERVVRCAMLVLLLYTVGVSIFSLTRDYSFDDFSIEYSEQNKVIYGEEYERIARESFGDGIKKAIFTKFGISEDDMLVYVDGFDFKSMSAKKIKIILTGSGVFGDFRAIESYIQEGGLGECEVRIYE